MKVKIKLKVLHALFIAASCCTVQ